MPQGLPQGMPQGLPHGMPQGMPQGMPHCMLVAFWLKTKLQKNTFCMLKQEWKSGKQALGLNATLTENYSFMG
jgi:hypothetical protein